MNGCGLGPQVSDFLNAIIHHWLSSLLRMGTGRRMSWSSQHLISADTGHTDSSVITISGAPAALHADEPDNQRFSTLET